MSDITFFSLNEISIIFIERSSFSLCCFRKVRQQYHIQGEPFAIARTIAEERHIKNVLLLQADLLVDNSSRLGCFDTVTLLHVLEHFTEQQMYQVLTHLLNVVSHRLIIAVPYESGEPEVAYDHKQLFSRQKLEAVGQWCIQQMNMGRVTYEYCEGGLLIVDRQ